MKGSPIEKVTLWEASHREDDSMEGPPIEKVALWKALP